MTALPESQQLTQTCKQATMLQEFVPTKLFCCGSALDIDAQTDTQESLDLFAQLLRLLQPWRAVSSDQVQGFEGLLIEIWWFGLRKRVSTIENIGQTTLTSSISMVMIPSDQMSTLFPYSRCLTTSGAIQYGVPTIVCRFVRVSVSLAQKPKSVILTLPFDERRTLSDLISRCTIFWACRCIRPLQVCNCVSAAFETKTNQITSRQMVAI